MVPVGGRVRRPGQRYEHHEHLERQRNRFYEFIFNYFYDFDDCGKVSENLEVVDYYIN